MATGGKSASKNGEPEEDGEEDEVRLIDVGDRCTKLGPRSSNDAATHQESNEESAAVAFRQDKGSSEREKAREEMRVCVVKKTSSERARNGAKKRFEPNQVVKKNLDVLCRSNEGRARNREHAGRTANGAD
jgi:hypothetical protein